MKTKLLLLLISLSALFCVCCDDSSTPVKRVVADIEKFDLKGKVAVVNEYEYMEDPTVVTGVEPYNTKRYEFNAQGFITYFNPMVLPEIAPESVNSRAGEQWRAVGETRYFYDAQGRIAKMTTKEPWGEPIEYLFSYGTHGRTVLLPLALGERPYMFVDNITEVKSAGIDYLFKCDGVKATFKLSLFSGDVNFTWHYGDRFLTSLDETLSRSDEVISSAKTLYTVDSRGYLLCEDRTMRYTGDEQAENIKITYQEKSYLRVESEIIHNGDELSSTVRFFYNTDLTLRAKTVEPAFSAGENENYSDYKFDNSGNWISRKRTSGAGEYAQVLWIVRAIEYR